MSNFVILNTSKLLCLIFLLLYLSVSNAENENNYQIPMQNKGTRTFYIHSSLYSNIKSLMLVDTGSSHSVINQKTLIELQALGNAKFLTNLEAIMADGSKKIVPLYEIASITLGDSCQLHDIKATVIPDSARQIIGISALQKAAPFGFSFNPPMLTLSHCDAIQSPLHTQDKHQGKL